MKKMLSLMLLMTSILCFTTCSNEEETRRPHVPNALALDVSETYDLGYKFDWTSTNTFVATVDASGIITAKKVGESYIYARDKNLSTTVYVNPNYTLYNTPITQWGISKNSIINKKGNPSSETSTLLTYNTSSTIAPIEKYLFENDKLKASAVFVKTAYTDEIVEHLSQRYELASYNNNYFIFMDAETIDEAENLITVSLSNTTYWLIMYTGNLTTRSSVDYINTLNALESKINNIEEAESQN